MRGKIIFAVGLAAGYVLGARAGRERYEQIKAGADKVWNTPTVQAGVEKVQEFAGQRVDLAKGKLADKAKDALAGLLGRKPYTQPSQSPAARTAGVGTTPSSATAAARSAAAKTAAKRPAAPKSGASKAATSKPTTSKPASADSDD